MAELQRPLFPFVNQAIFAVRGGLFYIRQQLNRRGQRLAAETNVGNPAFSLHLHQQQPMGTRRHMRRIGQHHAPQKAAHGKADLAQRSLQQAVLLEAVAAATTVNQLLFEGAIVEMYLSGQQHIQIFKGDRAVMVNMQFAQGVK